MTFHYHDVIFKVDKCPLFCLSLSQVVHVIIFNKLKVCRYQWKQVPVERDQRPWSLNRELLWNCTSMT